MAIIKYTAVHVTPIAHMGYIVNYEKTEEYEYVTGICCNDELELAYQDFKELYEMYDSEKFDLREIHEGKNHIRIHSYIQSFAASEVTPDQAHQISIEWCKAMFGEDRPVLITTHTNTDCIHNHIAVCPYDIHGNRWHANKTTLKLAKTVSDRLCLEHELSIITDPKRRSTMSYAEWLAAKGGTSWKVRMADDIDRFIQDPSVTDITSLVAKMKENGYVFTDEKHLIARPENAKRACFFYKLGYGYRYRVLELRIFQKNSEYLGRDISGYSGEQRNLIYHMQKTQYDIYREKYVPKYAEARTTERELREITELLSFISKNNIHSLNDLMNLVNERRRDESVKEYKRAEAELIYGYGSEQKKERSDEYVQARSVRYKTDNMYLRTLKILRKIDPTHDLPKTMPENGMLLSDEEKERRRQRALYEQQQRERQDRQHDYYSR